MSTDPHDQLLLQIRGAVAEYERYADFLSGVCKIIYAVFAGQIHCGRVCDGRAGGRVRESPRAVAGEQDAAEKYGAVRSAGRPGSR